ncbi:TetR/AcrR family transcriptional regulator [Xylophilus sp. GW821-FHT01B05]
MTFLRFLEADMKKSALRSETASWRDAGSRSEKSELIREALLRSAAEVVGELGYADASITMITQRAGVAQGTFYNHFKSRQDILDKLLPDVGEHMISHVRKKASGRGEFAELEERSFRAFFSFIKQTPHFSRILNEAESFAPLGYEQHFKTVSTGYIRFLNKALSNGDFIGYSEAELEVVAYMLMAARSYLAQRYATEDGKPIEIPNDVVNTYMKFVLFGLKGQASATKRRPPSSKSESP